jgi:hypothetical protein
MKKIVLVLVLMVVNLSFGQEKYIFKSGGRIYQNGEKISPDRVRDLLINDQKTLQIYNAGRDKKSVGNVFIYGGIATMIGKALVDYTTSSTRISSGNYYGSNVIQEEMTATGYILGGVMILGGGIIKGGFSKKIKRVVTVMNQNPKNPQTTFIESSSIMVNNDGVGISFTF